MVHQHTFEVYIIYEFSENIIQIVYNENSFTITFENGVVAACRYIDRGSEVGSLEFVETYDSFDNSNGILDRMYWMPLKDIYTLELYDSDIKCNKPHAIIKATKFYKVVSINNTLGTNYIVIILSKRIIYLEHFGTQLYDVLESVLNDSDINTDSLHEILHIKLFEDYAIIIMLSGLFYIYSFEIEDFEFGIFPLNLSEYRIKTNDIEGSYI